MAVRPEVLVFMRAAETVIRRASDAGNQLSEQEVIEVASCLSKHKMFVPTPGKEDSHLKN